MLKNMQSWNSGGHISETTSWKIALGKLVKTLHTLRWKNQKWCFKLHWRVRRAETDWHPVGKDLKQRPRNQYCGDGLSNCDHVCCTDATTKFTMRLLRSPWMWKVVCPWRHQQSQRCLRKMMKRARYWVKTWCFSLLYVAEGMLVYLHSLFANMMTILSKCTWLYLLIYSHMMGIWFCHVLSKYK